MTSKKWIDGVNAIGIISKAGNITAAIRQMKVLAEDTLKLTD